MRLIDNWRPRREPLTISEAISEHLDGRDTDRGSVEAATATADSCADMLGKLVQCLHQNGQLSQEQVASLAGSRFRAVE